MILSRNMVVKKVNVMNKEEAYSGEWPVKPYYKRDLAMGYAPDITPVAALNRQIGRAHV